MSSFDVGTAFVRVIPVDPGFAAALQAQVNKAVSQVKVPPLAATAAVETERIGAAASAAAVQQGVLAAATDASAVASTRQQAASLSLTRALEAQRVAEQQLATAQLAGADAARIELLQNRALIAQQTSAVAGARLGDVIAADAARAAVGTKALGAAAVETEKQVGSLATRNQVLQGSLVGISRVTPVAVFGLGLYGSAAIAAGLGIRSAITSAADFEAQLNTFRAVTGVTADQLDRVRETALALGADTSLAAISASDAAVALTELAKAGISVNNALAASRGVLELAGAASISAGDAARIVATQLNAFGLAGSQAVEIADLLAAASVAAQGEITDFAAAFQQVSSVANQSGLSIQQTTALLTELAKAGLQGADAGTSLRTTLLRFIPTTKEASQFVAALGVSLDETQTLGAQLPRVIEEYRNALSELNPVQRTTVLNQIFGQDAIRAASIIFDQSTGALDRYTAALSRGGDAAALNAAKAEGLAGATASLRSELDTAGTKIGEVADGPLEDLIRGFDNSVESAEILIEKLGELPPVFQQIRDNLPPPLQVGVDFVVNIVGPQGGDSDPTTRPGFLETLERGVTDPGGFVGILNDLIQGEGFFAPETVQSDVVAPAGFKDFQESVFGTFFQNAEKAQKEAFDKAFGVAARNFKKLHGDIQKNVADLIAKGLPGGEDGPGEAVVKAAASQRFQSPILEAQLTGNLQAELVATQAVEDFLAERLSRAKRGSAAFFIIQKALAAAHEQTLSVEREIASEQNKFQQDQAATLAETLRHRAFVLEQAAEDAGGIGAAERRFIAFLKRESEDQRLTQAQRDEFLRQLKAEQADFARNVTELAKEQIDIANARRNLRDAILETRLSAAELTPGIEDDKRIFNLQIKALDDDIKRQKALAAKAEEGSKEQIDALIQIQEDQQRINSIKQQIKNLQGGAGGGFTLAQLFQEAVDQFGTFGGNIAGRAGVLSAQDARGALGQQILSQRRDPAIAIQGAQLTEQEQQTELLTQILDQLRINPRAAVARANNPRLPTEFGNFNVAAIAANNGF